LISRYRIGDIVIQISHGNDELCNQIHSELKQYETKDKAEADCIIEINPGSKDFEVPEKAVYLGKWGNQAKLLHGDVTYTLWEGKALLASNLKNPWMRLDYSTPSKDILDLLRWTVKWSIIKTAESKGYSFIHGAAVRHNNRNIVFAGDAGCGKSSCFMRMLQNGAVAITDDNILIKENSIANFCLRTSIRGDFESRFSVSKDASFRVDCSNGLQGEHSFSGIDLLIFPKIWNSRSSKTEPMTLEAAARELTRIYMRENKSMEVPPREEKSVHSEYGKILKTARAFAFYAGSEEGEVKESLIRLCGD